MRILHLGNAQVVPALRALGHDVRAASQLCPLLVAPGRPVDVRVLHREIAPDAEVFFMADTLGPQTLAYGVEELAIPRVYWAIDVHVNFFWQRHYARLFDLALVAQQDYVASFEADGVPARWLPWGIDPRVFHDPGLARTIDIAFVGIVDGHRPKRAAALAELRRRFDVVTLGDDPARRLPESEMARVFGSAKIVFNESVMGDVNFRTFEAMACGALLLTERTDNGLVELFTPGEHLAAYGPDDLLALAAQHLAHSEERERIARNGCEAVAARHTMAARMATVTDWLVAGVARRDTRPVADAAFGVAAQLTIVRGLSDPAATLRLTAERLQAAALAGTDPDARRARADIMINSGRDDGALQLLRLAREARPADPRAWFLAAEVERRRGRQAEALGLFRGGIAAAAIPATLRDEALAAFDRPLASVDRLLASVDGPLASVDGPLASVDGPLASVDGPLASVDGPLASVDWPLASLDEPDGAAVWFAIGRVLQAVGIVMVPGFVRHDDADLPGTAMDYFQRSLEREPYAAPILEYVACVLELAGRLEYVRGYRERQVQIAPADPCVRRSFAETLHRAYAFTESAHHARVACVLADAPTSAGTLAEQAAAYREAGAALTTAGSAARAARALARAFALETAAAHPGAPPAFTTTIAPPVRPLGG
jgi:tetratricopeptide (TPR) repeat protein